MAKISAPERARSTASLPTWPSSIAPSASCPTSTPAVRSGPVGCAGPAFMRLLCEWRARSRWLLGWYHTSPAVHPDRAAQCRMHRHSVETAVGEMIPSKPIGGLHMVDVMLAVHEHDRGAEAETDRKIPKPWVVGIRRWGVDGHHLRGCTGRPLHDPPGTIALLAGAPHDLLRLAIDRRQRPVVATVRIVGRHVAGD